MKVLSLVAVVSALVFAPVAHAQTPPANKAEGSSRENRLQASK